jgi:hypothetical protein
MVGRMFVGKAQIIVFDATRSAKKDIVCVKNVNVSIHEN